MTKDVAKIKEEIRAELQAELKASREAFEREMRNELRDFRNEQRDIIKSLENSQADIDDLKKKLDVELAKNAKLERENDALGARCQVLENRVADLQSRLLQIEQYSRNCNLEIQGVEKKENENVVEIVSKIGMAISEPISETDIAACHRVPTRNSDKSNILVQFKSRDKRESALKKAKKMRLTNEDLGFQSTLPIYVNEHLCPTLKRLLGMAIKKKHEHQWKSVWSFKGKIYAKQTENSQMIHIADERDLAKIQ